MGIFAPSRSTEARNRLDSNVTGRRSDPNVTGRRGVTARTRSRRCAFGGARAPRAPGYGGRGTAAGGSVTPAGARRLPSRRRSPPGLPPTLAPPLVMEGFKFESRRH